ncbi:MAG: hypothetical protein ACRDSP_03980 [Pseudonocardiaceae bacterium]
MGQLRSQKQERAHLVRSLRASGKSWVEVASVLQQRYRVNARVALRYARCWSRRRAADEWNQRWPDELKTFKNFSYWELWPSSTGHAPSFENLSKLAELYECSASDLLVDLADFRHLDNASAADKPVAGQQHNTPVSLARRIVVDGPGDADLMLPNDASDWWHVAGDTATDEASRTREAMTPALAIGEPDGSSDDMRRRELLRLLSMIGVLVATSGVDDQFDSDRLACWPSNSDQLSDAAVDECAMLNAHLWRVFVLSRFKGAVFPLVRSQLEVLTVTLGQSSALTEHQRLCALTGELLQLAGEVFFDANKYTDAAHCYTLAAAACKEANAFDLWACALTRHSFIGMYERHFDKAAPMLELAQRLARRGDESLSTRYWVAAVQAQAFAGLGELAACQRALDVAEQIHELSGDVSNGGWLRFDGSRLAEERSACYVALRRFDLAESALGDALQQNLSARRRGSVLVDLAMIGVQRGDVDQLVTYADAALGMAEQTGSGSSAASCKGFKSILHRYSATVMFASSIIGS